MDAMQSDVMFRAWNEAFGIPPDSVEAQPLRWPDILPGEDLPFGGMRLSDILGSAQVRLGALAPEPEPPKPSAKPAVAGLLVTAGEKWR